MDFKKELQLLKDQIILEIKSNLDKLPNRTYYLTFDDEYIEYKDFYYDEEFYIPYRLIAVSLDHKDKLDLIFVKKSEEEPSFSYEEDPFGHEEFDFDDYKNKEQFRMLTESTLTVERLIQILEYF